jgi:hypothetical protein
VAEALMAADPSATPVTNSGAAGVAAFAGMNTVAGTVTFDGSALVSAIVTPPVGAGDDNVMPRGAVCPAATVMFGVIEIAPS